MNYGVILLTQMVTHLIYFTPQLSDYEKLRLRNIKRNDARLSALGLMKPDNDKKKSIKKKPIVKKDTPAVPLKRNEPRATRNKVNYFGEDDDNKDDKEDYQPDSDSSPLPPKRSLPQSLQSKKKKAKKKHLSKKASSKKTDESNDKKLNGFPKYLANEQLQSKLIHQYNKKDLQKVIEEMRDNGGVNALTTFECKAILRMLGKSADGSKAVVQDKVKMISNRRSAEGKNLLYSII